MSILIKGMEMPKSCYDCPMCYDMMECSIGTPRIGFCKNEMRLEPFDFCTERHPRCPLVPVPPHGRLIDADALVAEFHRLTLGENSLIERFFADGVYAVIQYSPTIIPAEEASDETV